MLLEVKHLTYKADQRTILNNINFKLDQGETVAVVGPSGSGKSTFLKQLNNLIKIKRMIYLIKSAYQIIV